MADGKQTDEKQNEYAQHQYFASPSQPLILVSGTGNIGIKFGYVAEQQLGPNSIQLNDPDKAAAL